MSSGFATFVSPEEGTESLAPPSFPSRYARFGPFQVDLQREELHKDGQRVKVQAKLYQALLVLLSRSGEIVTREEVCKRLWPEAMRVNLDANVNTTLNKLRSVLGDSTERPAYIETVPRRGYSFIAPVVFSEQALPVKANAGGRQEVSTDTDSKLWASWSLRFQPMPLRVASFVLVGMVIGALLVLAWNFASSKNHATQNLGRERISVAVEAAHKL